MYRLQREYAEHGIQAVIFHIDPLLTPRELAVLTDEFIAALSEEVSDESLTWVVDPSARVVLELDSRGLAELVIIDREGRIAYKGDFPEPYEALAKEIEKHL